MHQDLRSTQRRSGRVSMQPFEVDESRFKNIGKRTGKVFVKKDTSEHFDGFRRFSDLLSTSEQERYFKHDPFKEKQQQIVENIFNQNHEKPELEHHLAGISSIKKRKSMVNTLDKCCTGDMSLIKMIGDRNRDSLSNISMDMEHQSYTIQQFQFRQENIEEHPVQNQKRVSLDKLIDDLDCITQKQPLVGKQHVTVVSPPLIQGENNDKNPIKPRRIQPKVIVRRSQRTSILPFIDEKEIESSNKKQNLNALMQKITDIQQDLKKLDVPRKMRKDHQDMQKMETEPKPQIVVQLKVDVIAQNIPSPSETQNKVTREQVVRNQEKQKPQVIDEKAIQALLESNLPLKFDFQENINKVNSSKSHRMGEVVQANHPKQKSSRRPKNTRDLESSSDSQKQAIVKKVVRKTKESKANQKKSKKSKVLIEKSEDLQKIGGIIPIEQVVKKDHHSFHYPQRNRIQPLKYWECERVLLSRDRQIIGITNSHSGENQSKSSRYQKSIKSKHKETSPRNESIERVLGIKSKHKPVKQSSENNVFTFELKPDDNFRISNGKFNQINIVILEAKRNKIVYEDEQGTCKIKDYMIVQQIHSFTIRNSSNSERAVIQLKIK